MCLCCHSMDTILILLLHLSYLLTYITVHSPQRVGVMSLEVTGEKLISGGDDSMIRIWNTNNWTCEQILRAHQVRYRILSYYYIMAHHIMSYYISSHHITFLYITSLNVVSFISHCITSLNLPMSDLITLLLCTSLTHTALSAVTNFI